MGEEDIESNIVAVKGAVDAKTGEELPEDSYLLPADAWRDPNMLDWILAINSEEAGTTEAEFGDLMLKSFDSRANTGGISRLALHAQRPGRGTPGSDAAVDALIEKDSESLDENLQRMKDFYGPQKLKEMSPTEFYGAYKRIASGGVF